MPLYEYQCPKCGRFELIRKFSDPPLAGCPTCGQEVQKLLSAPAIQFKGTGWYVTDYARKEVRAGTADRRRRAARRPGRRAAPKTAASRRRAPDGEQGSSAKAHRQQGRHPGQGPGKDASSESRREPL